MMYGESIWHCRFVAEIAWETEVWLADAPDHLIHFDGQRFLGPYPNEEVS